APLCACWWAACTWVLLADLLDRLAAGVLRTRIADRLPLSAAAEAHARAEAGGFRGKLVLLP
ncbi:zinc-binding dehydrogenase, partial [Dactylosporangium sp. NPDC005572]|uniref:zinc-binding dehydrogenase n=1 Tax=Dactylosporangium sp. NPDC005572 TaxID=3156889 RepID=UPI0033A92184